MARSNSDKEAYSLISEYTRLYREKYGISPTINKYKEKWAFLSLIEDFGYENIEQTLSYYFKLTKDMHPLSWFVNNFSSLHISRIGAEKDAMLRSEQRRKTQELRAEYLNGVS
jgi:hypothetical protein